MARRLLFLFALFLASLSLISAVAAQDAGADSEFAEHPRILVKEKINAPALQGVKYDDPWRVARREPGEASEPLLGNRPSKGGLMSMFKKVPKNVPMKVESVVRNAQMGAKATSEGTSGVSVVAVQGGGNKAPAVGSAPRKMGK